MLANERHKSPNFLDSLVKNWLTDNGLLSLFSEFNFQNRSIILRGNAARLYHMNLIYLLIVQNDKQNYCRDYWQSVLYKIRNITRDHKYYW